MTPEKFSESAQASVEVVARDSTQQVLVVTTRPNPFREHVIDFEIANAVDFAGQGPQYERSFGDGQTAQSGDPYMAHDYGAAMPRDELYATFQVSVTLRRAGQPDLSAAKTVTLWSTYTYNKGQGFLQPPVQADEMLQPTPGGLAARLSVRNLEDEPISFGQRQVEYQRFDASAPSATAREPISLELAAQLWLAGR